jgi:hypothetical protein
MKLENLDVNQYSEIVSFVAHEMLDLVCTVVKFRGPKASDDGSVLPEDSKIDAISTYVSEFLMTNCHIAKIFGGDKGGDIRIAKLSRLEKKGLPINWARQILGGASRAGI